MDIQFPIVKKSFQIHFASGFSDEHKAVLFLAPRSDFIDCVGPVSKNSHKIRILSGKIKNADNRKCGSRRHALTKLSVFIILCVERKSRQFIQVGIKLNKEVGSQTYPAPHDAIRKLRLYPWL
jgi:hypothetical protein